MKKILILAKNSVANVFLQNLANLNDNTKEYIIIADEELSYSSNFTHIKIDPTNAARLKNYIDDKLEFVYILLDNEEDIRLAYNGVRSFAKRVNIVICSEDRVYENDTFCNLINPKKMISDHLIDMLPNMPMIARGIGLGEGEIMQVRVPTGSIYANKHINAIAQEYYKIALIYRGNKVILPKYDTQILANDELILVGDANILSLMFSRIKGQVGQFPSPYGDRICLIIDMIYDNNIDNLINTALLMHAKSNSAKLDIFILNPTINSHLKKLKSLRRKTINVYIKYDKIEICDVIGEFCKDYSGLFVVSKKVFNDNIEALYESAMPVLKVGKNDFAKLDTIACIGSSSLRVENLSSVILDVSMLLNIEAKLLYFDPTNQVSDDLLEHINMQAQFFGKTLKLVECKNKNPIFGIKSNPNIMQCLGFENSMLKGSSMKYLSNDFRKLYDLLDDNFQLFMPIE